MTLQITDLCSDYVESIGADRNWRRYENRYPALFRHYFHFWAKRAYPDITVSARTLRARADRICKRLPAIIARFERLKLPAAELTYVLFVGKGCTNGHAFKDGKSWVVWLPVELYSSDQLIDVFVTHEIAHALHYSNSQDYYFQNVRQQRHLGRQLVTEGLATYLTRQVLGCSHEMALWGGYLTKHQVKNWMLDGRYRLGELNRFALRRFDSSRRYEFFQGNEPSDIMRFRGGYFLGDLLIGQVVREHDLNLSKLIGLTRADLDRRVKQQLESGSQISQPESTSHH